MKQQLNTSMAKPLAVATLLTGLLFSATSFAESANTVHLGQSEVSKEQVIDLLAPKAGAPKTRGLRLHSSSDNAAEADPAANVERALSLEIYFQFDSAVLTQDAKEQLSPVGQALESNELANVDFTLEGHTDASGDASYNLQLSERRAQSVKNFFIENYSVSPERVQAQGKGESQILEGTSPTSGVNRRVTIIAQ